MTADDPATWRGVVHAFVRGFGLLETTTTPCGEPLPTSQAHALIELRSQPGLTQGELAALLGLTKSGVSRLVAKLVARGAVIRVVDERDRRARRLRLSAAGRKLATRVNRGSLDRFSQLMHGVPPRHRAAVLESLRLLVEATPPPAWREVSA